MPVLNIASGRVNESASNRSTSASGGNGQSSAASDDADRIDIAGRLSELLEDFVTGLIPGQTSVNLNWGALSPIFSVLGDIVGVAGLLVGWL